MYTNAMGEITQVVEAFRDVDGIEVNETVFSDGEQLVKIMDEDAVGQFFARVRQNDVEYRRLTRNDIAHTVMDAWVFPDE
jgi:hypothetical protein